MAELFVPLRVTPGIEGVYLKEICGKDEISVEGIGTKTALALLDGLVKNGDAHHLANHFNAAKIVTADRDRILAHLYISIYGPKVQSVLDCQNCDEQFDLDFSLIDFLNHYQLAFDLGSEDGVYKIESGGSFRLPTGEDELMLAGLPVTDAEDLLINRCLVSGDMEIDKVSIQEKMSEIASILDIEMLSNCPECGHENHAQFDIQSFLLMKLKQERFRLIQEIHSIAINYHWTQNEILELPRSLRKQYVSLIES